MTIVGFDFHPSWQQIAILDMETGEVRECGWLTVTEKPSDSIGSCRVPL
jgi:hypothetical protein